MFFISKTSFKKKKRSTRGALIEYKGLTEPD